MTLEGRDPCIRVMRDRLREFNGALQRAGYERKKTLLLNVDGEISAWAKKTGTGKWSIVHVIESGRFLQLYATIEEGRLKKGMTKTSKNWGFGCAGLRRDLKKTGLKFN